MPIKEVCTKRISSFKSDSWSFGIVLWEIFSGGKLPYEGYNNEQTLAQVQNGYRLPPPENMPEEVATIMSDCWKHK